VELDIQRQLLMRQDTSENPSPPVARVAPLGEMPRGATGPDESKGRGMLPPAAGSALAVAVAAAFALAVILPATPIRSTLWGLLVLAAMIGYGTALGAWLYPRRGLDWGLRAALGMASVIALGGLLAALHLVSVASSAAVVLAGLGCLAFHEARRASVTSRPPEDGDAARPRHRRPLVVTGTLLIASLLAYRYLFSVGNAKFDPWDDNIAYFEFAKQMLASGTLIEPFSVRRIAALGGQTYLHSLALARGALPNLHVVDNGIALLILVGLVLGYSRRGGRAQRVAELAALLLIVTVPRLPYNIASEFTGCVCFFGLLRVLREEDDAGRRLGWRGAAALALFPAAAMTLRQSNLVAAAVVPALGLLHFARQAPRADRRAWAVQAARTAIVAVALLVPWWVLSLRSCGTFLYPLFVGWGKRDFGLMGTVPLVSRLRFVAGPLISGGGGSLIPALLAFFIAGAFLAGRRSQALVKVFLLGGALGALAIMWGIAPIDDTSSAARYHFAVVFPCVLAVCLEAIPALADWRRRGRAWVTLIAPILTACAIAIQLAFATAYRIETSPGRTLGFYRDLRVAASALSASPIRRDGTDEVYARLQGAVPPGERLLVMLDEPFRLDFRRNAIVNFDQPGAVSPPPGIKLGQGPEALARYLSSQSIRYIAFRISDRSPEYKASIWEGIEKWTVAWTGSSRSSQLKSQARYYLDAFGNLRGLGRTRRRLFDEDEYLVLDLKEPNH
jgi:hypothetical protein